jgi:anti-anti-sigma regulatory factor
MNITEYDVDNVRIMRLDTTRFAGPEAAQILRNRFSEAVHSGHLVLAVDLTNVQFIDRESVRVLIEEFKRINRYHGSIGVFGAIDDMRDFLHQNMLDELVDIADDESAMLNLFAGRTKRRRIVKTIYDWFTRIQTWIYLHKIWPERRTDGHRRFRPDRRSLLDRRQTTDDDVVSEIAATHV